MLIDTAIEKVHQLISFFGTYRESAFSNALEVLEKIAIEMDIDPNFHTKRKITRKRQFDESAEDASVASQSAEEKFRVNYFLAIVDLHLVGDLNNIRSSKIIQGQQKNDLDNSLLSSSAESSLERPSVFSMLC